MNILITGGLGFIGGQFLTKIKDKNPFDQIIVFDKMTYASNYSRVKGVFEKNNFLLVKGDVANKDDVQDVFQTHKPNIIINFAAESHVDNSIKNPFFTKFLLMRFLDPCPALILLMKNLHILPIAHIAHRRQVQITL